MKKSIIAGIWIITAFFSHGQKYVKVFEQAETSFYNEQFSDALILYNQVHQKNPKYKDTEYKMEICSLLLVENKNRPLHKILSYEKLKGVYDKFYYYWLGRIYTTKYMFPEALQAWKKFLNRKGQKSEIIIDETKSFIEHAEFMLSYFDNPDNYEVHQLENTINSTGSELSPVYASDRKELIFSSNTQALKPDQFQLYSSVQISPRSWSEPQAITSIGTFSSEEANIELVDEDGRLFIFLDKKGGTLYYSEFGNDWNVPKEFDSKLSKAHIASHFFINEHEDRIIFSGKNGKNGLDLYETFRDAETGKWIKPHLLSGNVNHDSNEDSPFLSHDEQMLYFSSDRQGGVGGYDIYFSSLDQTTGQWSEPVNMGWPINSPDDEIHFKLNPDQQSGYFVSDRLHSQGESDIYFFWPIQKLAIQGRVLDPRSGKPLSSGEIRFHPSMYKDEYFRSPIDEFGNYHTAIISDEIFQVEVISESDTLMLDRFEIHKTDDLKTTYLKDFTLGIRTFDLEPALKDAGQNESQPIIAKVEIPKNEDKTTEIEVGHGFTEVSIEKTTEKKAEHPVRIVSGNIYFESGKTSLENEYNPVLKNLFVKMMVESDLNVEIAGHSDANENGAVYISLQRAKTIRQWLIERGIDQERLSIKGYGSSRPLASNDDEVNGRELNRRIEVTLRQ